jgi:hypothetical protein
MRRRMTWLAASAAAVGLGPWLPGWLTAAGLDAWNAPALHRQVAANLHEESRLTAQIADVQEQIRTKDWLSEELIAGRITLAEATEQFEPMVNAKPEFVVDLRVKYPKVATDRERVARHVIDYARSRLDAADRDRDLLAVRMTTELEALFPPTRPVTPPVTYTMG